MYLYVSWLAWLARKMQILNSACITQQLVAGTLSAEIRNKIHWRFKKLSSLFLFNQNMYSFLNPATRISCGHTMRRITRHAYILKKRRRRTQHRQHQAIKIWVAMMSTLLVCRLLSLEVDLHIANEMHRDLEAAMSFRGRLKLSSTVGPKTQTRPIKSCESRKTSVNMLFVHHRSFVI